MLSLSLNYGIGEMLTGGCPEPRNRPSYGKGPKHKVFAVIQNIGHRVFEDLFRCPAAGLARRTGNRQGQAVTCPCG